MTAPQSPEEAWQEVRRRNALALRRVQDFAATHLSVGTSEIEFVRICLQLLDAVPDVINAETEDPANEEIREWLEWRRDGLRSTGVK